MTTAFVLAGGGSLGAVEVGMLRELLSWGEVPSFVVGASAGAIKQVPGSAIERAAKTTRQWLEEGGLDRVGTPMQLHVHAH